MPDNSENNNKLDVSKAVSYFENANYEKSFELFSVLAEHESGEAQMYMGLLYQYGLGVKKNQVNALQYYEKSSTSGNSKAQFHLAKFYLLKGEYTKSLTYLKESVNDNYSPSLYWLALLYKEGKGVNKDIDMYKSLLRKSIKNGHIFSKKEYAMYHLTHSSNPLKLMRFILMYITCFIDGAITMMREKNIDLLKSYVDDDIFDLVTNERLLK